MSLKTVTIIFAVVVCCNAVQLPSYFRQCKKDDSLNKCIKTVANEGIRAFSKGDPKVHLPPVDPLHVNEMFVDIDGNLKMNFTDFDITGVSDATIENWVWDFDNEKLEFDIMIPSAKLLGHYDISGKILILPISGVGPCNITYVNGVYKFQMDYKLQEKNGKQYANIVKGAMTFKVDRAYFHLSNLFGGNPRLGEEMLKFLDENWKEANDEVGKGVGDALAQIFTHVVKTFLSKVPLSELFN